MLVSDVMGSGTTATLAAASTPVSESGTTARVPSGTEMRLTVSPANNFRVGSVMLVADSGYVKHIDLVDNAATFHMPAESVKVMVTVLTAIGGDGAARYTAAVDATAGGSALLYPASGTAADGAESVRPGRRPDVWS